MGGGGAHLYLKLIIILVLKKKKNLISRVVFQDQAVLPVFIIFGHDGQFKEKACKNMYLGSVFIREKYKCPPSLFAWSWTSRGVPWTCNHDEWKFELVMSLCKLCNSFIHFVARSRLSPQIFGLWRKHARDQIFVIFCPSQIRKQIDHQHYNCLSIFNVTFKPFLITETLIKIKRFSFICILTGSTPRQ